MFFGGGLQSSWIFIDRRGHHCFIDSLNLSYLKHVAYVVSLDVI